MQRLWGCWFFGLAVLACLCVCSCGNLSGNMTKEEFVKKLADYEERQTDRTRGWNKSDFIAKVGKPDRKQKIGDEVYWYYNCSDGHVQLVMDAYELMQMGRIELTNWNEF